MDRTDKTFLTLFIGVILFGLGALVYGINTAGYNSAPETNTAPWIQVPESGTSFLPIDLSDGTRCVALKVEERVAITCNWSTTQTQ